MSAGHGVEVTLRWPRSSDGELSWDDGASHHSVLDGEETVFRYSYLASQPFVFRPQATASSMVRWPRSHEANICETD